MVGLIDESFKELCVNSRIKVLEDYGTVRYIGEVKNYSGVWIGIDWDVPSRGKHNGTVGGVQYFDTKFPTSGSMIRCEKLAKFQSLRHAIDERYLSYDSSDALDEELLRETESQLQASFFKIVGMEKVAKQQSCLERLVDVSVAESTVNSAGDLGPLKCLTVLNVSSTLIWNWRIVADITRQIPTLRSISLSLNRLVLPSEEEIVSLEPSFRHVNQINLSKSGLSDWQTVLYIAQLWPNVESLLLEQNEIASLAVPDCQKVFKNLKELYLSWNNLSDFNEICKLGHIETLERLFLIANNIREIILPNCNHQEKLKIFASLKTLNLNSNPISDSAKIFNELDKLPALEGLSKTPEKPSNFDEMFAMAVASMAQLKMLNKAVITAEQRRGAEYEIWKKYANEWQKTENNRIDREEFCKEHRTYTNIVKRCGSPSDFSTNSWKPRPNAIKIRIVHKPSEQSFEKKVPRLMSLHALQGFVIKHFHLIDNMPKMSYQDDEHPDLIVPLDNLSKNLDFYSICDGDTVIVE